jgi:hypothetical protein
MSTLDYRGRFVDERNARTKQEQFLRRCKIYLTAELTTEFGKGFSVQSLWNMRQFYNAFPILSTLWRELSWNHYAFILKVENPQTRLWYIGEK